MLSVVMLNVIMLSVIMLSVIMLSVIMLTVIMLSVVAPKNGLAYCLLFYFWQCCRDNMPSRRFNMCVFVSSKNC
jgi:hypothetical protein